MPLNTLNTKTLATIIEHTLLGDDINEAQIKSFIADAKELKVYALCLPMEWLKVAKTELNGAPIKLVTVIDFPKGNKSAADKANQAALAQKLGACEIDMVADYDALINRNYQKYLYDIMSVVKAANLPIKVIVETSALNREQLIAAITLVSLSGAHFIKTSTGFHDAGAQVEDIALMRRLLPDDIKIKASGGIRSFEQACAMVSAGAERIGTSNSKAILFNS